MVSLTMLVWEDTPELISVLVILSQLPCTVPTVLSWLCCHGFAVPAAQPWLSWWKFSLDCPLKWPQVVPNCVARLAESRDSWKASLITEVFLLYNARKNLAKILFLKPNLYRAGQQIHFEPALNVLSLSCFNFCFDYQICLSCLNAIRNKYESK